MRLIRRLIDSLKGKPDAANLTEGVETRIDPYEWRPMNIRREGYDLSPRTRGEMYERAFEAWMSDPMAGHIVNLTSWFVMGEGLTFAASDERVQRALDDFWNDTDNGWDALQEFISDELQVFGETFLRLFINPMSGHIKAMLLDPREIVDISFNDSNGRPASYLRRYTRRVYRESLDNSAAGFDYDEEDADEIIPANEIIHLTVNRLSSSSRGISELYRVLPWLELYSQWLRDRVSLNRARASFAYLRKVPGTPAQAKDVFERDSITGRVRPPRAGSVLVVNEGEDWQVLHPSVGADDVKEDGRALKLMIAAGSGIFEHYFGDPSTGNLATTKSMELPMLKKFEARQRLLGKFYSGLFGRVIREAKAAGRLPVDCDESVEVEFPPIVRSEVADITQTLIAQLGAGLISKRRALSINPWVEDVELEIERAGLEIDSEENPNKEGE